MIMSFKQRKIKFKPRIKLNHNIYNIIYLSFKEGLGVGRGDTTVDEALACHQFGLGSSTGVDAISTWVEFAAGFLPFLREVSLRVLQFFPLLKKQKPTFQIPIRWGKCLQ